MSAAEVTRVARMLYGSIADRWPLDQHHFDKVGPATQSIYLAMARAVVADMREALIDYEAQHFRRCPSNPLSPTWKRDHHPDDPRECTCGLAARLAP